MDTATLYRELVLEHNRNPRHRGLPAMASLRARGANPLCGDELEIGLEVQDGLVAAIGFEAEASALTVACCSILAELCQGQPLAEVQVLARQALDLYTANPQRTPRPELGALNAMLGVLDYPNRIKTVTLPVATLLAALSGSGAASTDLDVRGGIAA